jgi:hypothetical protein
MRESGTRPTTDHSAMIAWVESRSLGGKPNAGRFGDAKKPQVFGTKGYDLPVSARGDGDATQ